MFDENVFNLNSELHDKSSDNNVSLNLNSQENNIEEWENTPEINLQLPTDNEFHPTEQVDIVHHIYPTSKYIDDIFNDYCEINDEHLVYDSSCMCLNLFPKFNDNKIFQNQLKKLDYLAYLNHDICSVNYMKILKDIYCSLTSTNFSCSDSGNHWTYIGFQSSHPSSDLRSFGLLSLLCIHQFTVESISKSLSHRIFQLSQDEVQNFPFCILCMNVTKILFLELKAMRLNEFFANDNDIILRFFKLFNTLLYKFYMVWRNEGKTIVDSQFVLQMLEKLLKNQWRKLVLSYEATVAGEAVMEYGDISIIPREEG